MWRLIEIGYVNAVRISSDNSFFVTAGGDRSVKVFDLNTKKRINKFERLHSSNISNEKKNMTYLLSRFNLVYGTIIRQQICSNWCL